MDGGAKACSVVSHPFLCALEVRCNLFHDDHDDDEQLCARTTVCCIPLYVRSAAYILRSYYHILPLYLRHQVHRSRTPPPSPLLIHISYTQ